MPIKRNDVCDCDTVHGEIVEQVKPKMLPDDTFAALSGFLKSVGDGTRMRILWALIQHEMCVCDLAALLCMTKSAISHQLRELKDANLVKFTKSGKIALYRVADDHVRTILTQSITHVTE